MPQIRIDDTTVDVPEGASVLDAARRAGIDIPALCHRDGCEATTSCMVCVVRVEGQPGLVPACATPATDGLVVESETDEVRAARRAALELLLADHLGDCVAPCELACPAGLDVPRMIRCVAAGRLDEAIEVVRRDIPLPAILGRICPAPCERACRRSSADGALAIRLLKRYVGDAALAAARDAEAAPDTGRRVAVVGAGPAGLAAAWYLRAAGVGVTVFDEADQPGGGMRLIEPDRLPPDVLAAETAAVFRLGAEFRPGVRVGSGHSTSAKTVSLDELREELDAVVLAVGELDSDKAAALGVELAGKGIGVERGTGRTSLPGVFAAGSAVRPGRLAVRALADGRNAARCVIDFLAGREIRPQARPLSTHVGRPSDEEMHTFLAGAADRPRVEPAGDEGLSTEQARDEAARCLHCDCRKRETCRLRIYAERYGASPSAWSLPRRTFERDASHPEVVYEPGKCIDCGICIAVAAEEAARAGSKTDTPAGLCFVGRGFDVRVRPPFGMTIADALGSAAVRCADACPTGALSRREDRQKEFRDSLKKINDRFGDDLKRLADQSDR